MSEIRATTISDAAGTGPITLTGQSASKMWVSYTSASTTTINGSFNVSSLTDIGTGSTNVNITNAFNDVNSLVTAGISNQYHMLDGTAPSTSTFRYNTYNSSHTPIDSGRNYGLGFGDLA